MEMMILVLKREERWQEARMWSEQMNQQLERRKLLSPEQKEAQKQENRCACTAPAVTTGTCFSTNSKQEETASLLHKHCSISMPFNTLPLACSQANGLIRLVHIAPQDAGGFLSPSCMFPSHLVFRDLV